MICVATISLLTVSCSLLGGDEKGEGGEEEVGPMAPGPFLRRVTCVGRS